MNTAILRNRLAAFGMLLIALAGGATASADSLNFVSCPVYRDTDNGRKSGCWLVTDLATGVQYDISSARSKPLFNHQALVEGQVAREQTNRCGAVILDPVSQSVLDAPCKSIMLPGEGYPGMAAVLPSEIIMPVKVPRKLPEAPFTRQRFEVLFNFDSDFIVYQGADVMVERAALYATTSKARQVTVTATADTRGAKVSGAHLAEQTNVALKRAEMIAEALRRLGVAPASIHLQQDLKPDALPGAELPMASRRRVTIEVTP
jgi:outer membrane protein OmpA-like peptidoglycan-associated protein